MADINLRPSESITFSLNTTDDTLTIQISESGLNNILKKLEGVDGSVIKNLLNELADLRSQVQTLNDTLANHTHSVDDLTDLQIGGSAASTDKLHIKY